jgi:hypothetical protein
MNIMSIRAIERDGHSLARLLLAETTLLKTGTLVLGGRDCLGKRSSLSVRYPTRLSAMRATVPSGWFNSKIFRSLFTVARS